MTRAPLLLPLLLLAACGTDAPRADQPTAQPREKTVKLMPFAWPPDQAPLATRGGTSVGEPVTLAAEPSPAWTALQATPPGIERDRAAIRALAGEYRITFDFQETIALRPKQPLTAPYHSWATERIFVIADTPARITLQHQLVMRFAAHPGQAMVVKHWRQDWTWQDGDLLRYQGLGVWRREQREAAEVAGCWSQAVYGVGDEPRYETVGRWRHDGQSSEWISDRHLRPLPRREYSVRKDYHALDGSHRIVITPGGWVLWQENRKLPLAAPGQPAADGPLAIEIGCERYERLAGFDWQPGIDEWKAQEAAWVQLRAAWDERLAAPETRLGEEQKIGAEILGEVSDGDVPGALNALHETPSATKQ